MKDHKVTLRRVEPTDEPFLRALYITTRDDLAHLPLSEDQKSSLLLMQYEAQRRQYEIEFPQADHDIVLYGGKAVGRYLIDQREDEIMGIDLSILPEYRSLGIGATVIGNTLKEAKSSDRPFRFHVSVNNRRAMRLYERLGCSVSGSSATEFEMEWRAAGGRS